MKSHKPTYSLLTVLLVVALLYSCASIGNPSGGPQDKMPPIFVSSSPRPNALNIDRKKIELHFDEIVTLDDPMNKIIVSPAQTELPKITANGRTVTVEIIDSLKANTTYTIDFTNALQDNNENNPIDNFAFAFSTGDTIDSLRVSGMVLDSHTLEPQQGVLVGMHSNLADSAFKTIRLERMTRTNDRGQFTIRNLKPGRYRIFALNDLDRDYKANRTEDIAFLDSLIIPSAAREEMQDTLYGADGKVDTVITRMHTAYYPNDILLSMFNEHYVAQYMTDYSRIDSTRLSLIFATKSDSLPRLRIINKTPEPQDWYELERSTNNDTLTYWLKQPEIVSSDSLQIEVTALRTDTLDNLVWGTDTLNFNFKRPKPQKKKKKKDEEADTLPPQIPFLGVKLVSATTQEVYAPLVFESPEPLARFDTTMVHLELKEDSLWTELKDYRLSYRDSSLNRRQFTLRYSWEPGETYRFRLDSLAMTNIYGVFNAPFESELKVRSLDEYGNLFFVIPEAPDSSWVELLDKSDNCVMKVPVRNQRAEFINMLPARYYARLFVDRNGNGEYDTGNYDLHLQPEETYYYPKAVNLKQNWDVEQTWNLNELPVDMQKPKEIRKNKPERNKWAAPEQTTTDEEDESGFNEFGDPNDPNQRYFDQLNGNYNPNGYSNYGF